MRKIIILLLTLIVTINIYANNDIVDSLMITLDSELSHSSQMISRKFTKIENLKQSKKRSLSKDSLFRINEKIVDSYESINSDSAIHYLFHNYDIAQSIKNTKAQNEILVKVSFLFSSIGSYKEAIDMLSLVKRPFLSERLLIEYYNSFESTYYELSHYTKNELLRSEYVSISNKYRDSLFQILPNDSDLKLLIREIALRDSGELVKALEINAIRLSQVNPSEHKYAIICFYRSLIYKGLKDIKKEKEWLMKSAILDAKLAIADNASLWRLTNIFYEEGNLEVANRYMTYTIDNAVIFNAPLRYGQILSYHGAINNSFQEKRLSYEKMLLRGLLILFILVSLFFISIVIIKRQMSTLSQSDKIREQINNELNVVNKDLAFSNKLKELYIGRLLVLSSSYIEKMDEYHRQINKNFKNENYSKVKQILNQPIAAEELDKLYETFDSTFLTIFPTFVEQVNEQLDEPFILKVQGRLTTELRILALIRLEINDSSRIAEILRYSVNTIYNYRAQLKKRYKGNKEEFEDMIMQIN